MVSKLCPTRKFCWDKGDCENCGYGIAFEKLNKKIKKLTKKVNRLSLDLLATTKTAESIKADTIREMRELLHARKVSYGNLTFRVVPLDDIDQIVKELLEDKQ